MTATPRHATPRHATPRHATSFFYDFLGRVTDPLRANWWVAILRVVILLIVVYGMMPSAFAAFDISKAGDLTATDFDELGFDTTGLVGYWQLNGNAHDSSGHGNNGTIYGAAATTDRFGVANGAMSFNGNGDYVDFGSRASLIISDAFTISFWINDAGSAGKNRFIINKGSPDVTSSDLDVYRGWLDGQYRIKIRTITAVAYTVYVDAPINVWTSITFTFDSGNNTLTSYKDGQFKAVTATTSKLHTNAYPLLIGDSYLPFNYKPLQGSIDEVKIFNRALTATEILSMYNHEKGKFSVGKDGKAKAVSFVEDPALPVQMRSKKKSLTVKGHLIQQ